VRPSDFEDAAIADQAWPRITVTAGVTEELGSEIHILFTIDAPSVRHPSLGEIAGSSADADEAVGVLAGGKSLWTGRVAARSKIRSGQPAGLAVDATNLQFFDPDTGLSIGRPETPLG
jgi:multiple sugar transport system ATP-binding protein